VSRDKAGTDDPPEEIVCSASPLLGVSGATIPVVARTNTTPLCEEDVNPDPFVQFERWFAEAARVVEMPEAMALATADVTGRPSVRMVLMKERGPAGFVFHTDYSSSKGMELVSNPRAALLFYWDPLGRQIRIEGTVTRLSDAESDAYFATRPRGAQLAARASDQSSVVADRAALDAAVQAQDDQFRGEAVPRPEGWGGFRLTPEVFEYWQNRADRLHDRLRYRRDDRGAGEGWVMERLQP
jgi:pyridoxamine 5'-phosphate oxidase